MAAKNPKGAPDGIPIKFDQDTYRDLKDVARLLERKVQDLARELMRTSLALRMSKLGPELAQLRKEDEARAARAEKARKKIED